MEARSSDRRAGRPVYFPVRYADDFIVLVSGAAEDAAAEREALATVLQQRMGLTLSPEKTRITPLTDGFEFLGHRVRMRWDMRYGWTPRIEVPKEQVADLRYTVKPLTGRATTPLPLIALLQTLNPILRGWAHFYRHCTGAKDILSNLDWYVGDRLWRWMRKKYPKAHVRTLLRHRRPSRIRRTRRVWQEDGCEQFQMSLLKVERYKRGWMQHPDFTTCAGEPDAERTVHVRFGERACETTGRKTGMARMSYSTPIFRCVGASSTCLRFWTGPLVGSWPGGCPIR